MADKAEANAADHPSEESSADEASAAQGSVENRLKRAIFSVPIEVVVSVGAARPLIGDLLAMKQDQTLPLDTSLEDPVELLVKNKVIARGVLTQAEDGSGKLGIRLTEIVDMSDIF